MIISTIVHLTCQSHTCTGVDARGVQRFQGADSHQQTERG